MSELFTGFEYVCAHLDDLLTIIHGTYDDHLEKLKKVLKKLQEANLKVNIKKLNKGTIHSYFYMLQLQKVILDLNNGISNI